MSPEIADSAPRDFNPFDAPSQPSAVHMRGRSNTMDSSMTVTTEMRRGHAYQNSTVATLPPTYSASVRSRASIYEQQQQQHNPAARYAQQARPSPPASPTTAMPPWAPYAKPHLVTRPSFRTTRSYSSADLSPEMPPPASPPHSRSNSGGSMEKRPLPMDEMERFFEEVWACL